jgi:hypothetical protein
MEGVNRLGKRIVRGVGLLAPLTVLAGLAVFSGGASAATPAQAIANLNAQRAANGIPAGITENPVASKACADHNNYERLNGGELTHEEQPGNPGYTTDGNDAAEHSVLASGENWNSANPWETAPIHLAQLLDPYLAQMGVDDSDGFVCATTLPANTGDAAVFQGPFPAISGYSYPGNGTSGWPTSETAAEGPFTPGDLVGLPQPTTTGPYLYVLFDGPWQGYGGVYVKIDSATLTGPQGAVPIKTVDGTTQTSTNGGIPLGDYIGSSAMVIPTVTLRAGTTYTAQVSGSVNYNGTRPVSESFTFTTAGASSGLPVGGKPPGSGSAPAQPGTGKSHLRLSKGHRRHGVLTFTLTATGAYRGRRARITIKTGGRVMRSSKSKLRGNTTIGIADVRHATVLVTVKAFTAGGIHFKKKTLKRSA